MRSLQEVVEGAFEVLQQEVEVEDLIRLDRPRSGMGGGCRKDVLDHELVVLFQQRFDP